MDRFDCDFDTYDCRDRRESDGPAERLGGATVDFGALHPENAAGIGL